MTSMRGHLLVYGARHAHPPVVTVENYCKGYALQVVMPSGDIAEYDFGALEPHATNYVEDHCPNPVAVVRWAIAHGFRVDGQSLEMMLGRWMLEATPRNANDFLKELNDALPPDALDALLRRTINSYVDRDKMDAQITHENIVKARLQKLASHSLLEV